MYNYSVFCSQIEDRVFISNSKCRILLSKYAKTWEDNATLVAFDNTHTEELKHLLSIYSPSLFQLLETWNFTVPCCMQYAPLLGALATASAVCALLPPTQSNLSLMEKLISGYNVRSDPSLWALTQKSFPLLFKLIVSLDVTKVPGELVPVLTDIVNKSKRPFEIVVPEPEITQTGIDDSCSFYPHLTRKRSRRLYKADLNRKHSTCSKFYRGHPSLLPGIFTAFCPHGNCSKAFEQYHIPNAAVGVCIGFEVMSSYESPNIPFTLFKTRFSKGNFKLHVD